MNIPQKYHFFINLALIIFFSLFFSQKIALVSQDLGRHLTNGKIFFETGKIISTNFYSYTEPEFETINHHWLSGLFFYLIYKLSGFSGLSIFYLLISGLTVFIFFKKAEEKSNFTLALLLTFLLLPLLSQRKEIRPEGFSYLFIAIYYYLLSLFVDKRISFNKVLPALIISQIIWVNSHIFFIFGIFICLVFAFLELIKQKKSITKQLVIILFSVIIASMVNPYGIKGLIEPFNIFKQYGYMIVENQSIFFMQKLYPTFTYIYVEIFALFFLGILSFTYNKEKFKNTSTILILTITFMVLAFKMIRIIPIFGLFLLPFLAENLFVQYEDYFKNLSPYVLPIIFISIIPNHFFSALPLGKGVGLVPNINASAEFYKNLQISGPIFNNYDIGGYLIFHLNDKEKVFVDNRPEAYSVEFFKNTYVPMQENENTWKDLEGKYNFNTIFFYRLDLTPWAQNFLITRIKDSSWVPVFVDAYTIIFVKNNGRNKEIIKNYALPKEMFAIR